MSNRICSKCRSKCILIPLSCLFDGLTLLHSGLDTNKVLAAMDTAQQTYIMPYLSKVCFEELCTALDNSELPDSDENYEVLAEKWDNLVTNLTELLIVATEYTYLNRLGFASLKKSGIVFAEEFSLESFDHLMHVRKTEINALRGIFRDWLEENRETYSCLPENTKGCLSDGDDESGLDAPFSEMIVI